MQLNFRIQTPMPSKADSKMFCKICLEKVNRQEKKPIFLPACGHSFCRQCLIRLYEEEGRIECPICRIPHQGQSPENLVVNWSLLEMLEDEDESTVQKTTTKNTREAPISQNQDSKDYGENFKSPKAKDSTISENGNNSDNEPPSKFWRNAGIIAGTVIGGVGAVAAVPVVLTGIGFTSAGIAASSWAAGMMSSAAIANGGGVAAGSAVAVLQSIGAAGMGPAATGAVASVGAGIGGGATYIANKLSGGASQEENNSNCSDADFKKAKKEDDDDPEKGKADGFYETKHKKDEDEKDDSDLSD